jgi:RHS repeat-associated protein
VTAGTTKDFIQANGRTWGVMEATSNTYFHHDAIGSVVALSNESGQVTDTYEYEPFGKVLDHQGTSTNDYQFVGGYGVRKLNDTLDTMGVRQYSKMVGRFTTRDPIGTKDDINMYRYVGNKPIISIDPMGLAQFCRRALEPGDLEIYYSGGMINFYHEQIFYSDRITNIGFFPTGVGPDSGHTISDYNFCSEEYNDECIRKAVAIVAPKFTSFNIVTNNCQTFASEVKFVYRYLQNTGKCCSK